MARYFEVHLAILVTYQQRDRNSYQIVRYSSPQALVPIERTYHLGALAPCWKCRSQKRALAPSNLGLGLRTGFRKGQIRRWWPGR